MPCLHRRRAWRIAGRPCRLPCHDNFCGGGRRIAFFRAAVHVHFRRNGQRGGACPLVSPARACGILARKTNRRGSRAAGPPALHRPASSGCIPRNGSILRPLRRILREIAAMKMAQIYSATIQISYAKSEFTFGSLAAAIRSHWCNAVFLAPRRYPHTR